MTFIKQKQLNIWISVFVVAWSLLFHYESIRYFYLEPLAGQSLPKTKFLFPPAGWIMFFQVDSSYGLAEVYGIHEGVAEPIDPHRIFETQAVGYDNIHRNVLSSVVSPDRRTSFCQFLRRKFPEYQEFWVVSVYYPDVIKEPTKKLYRPEYACQE